jgi:hypothetical protein
MRSKDYPLVGLCEHSRRHLDAERFRGLEIDGESVLGRLLNRPGSSHPRLSGSLSDARECRSPPGSKPFSEAMAGKTTVHNE